MKEEFNIEEFRQGLKLLYTQSVLTKQAIKENRSMTKRLSNAEYNLAVIEKNSGILLNIFCKHFPEKK